MTAFVRVENLTKTYPVATGMWSETLRVQALTGVTLNIAKGEALGLVGESGCGKSTLGRQLVGLEKPDSGSVSIDGRAIDPRAGSAFHRQVQMIFQDPYSSLNPRWSVGGIIREPLDIHKVGSRAERKQRVAELLEVVGLLPEHAKRYPHQFSGGQRQRVAIARALALNPQFLVCDEPVSALDVSIQAQVLNLLHDLRKQFGLTYLFISHDLSVVSSLCDRVAVMYLGRIVEVAGQDEIFTTPLHPYTQALIASIPQPDPEAGDESVPLSGDLPSPLSPPGGCPFHPRCPKAFAVCSRTFPHERTMENGRTVSCHLY